MRDEKIFISCGEQSGDFHASLLVKELKSSIKNSKFFGIGGDRLKSLGVKIISDIEKTQIIGFWEVLPKIFYFYKLLHLVYKEIKKYKPKLCILIDYPGFNLILAKMFHSLGIKVVYYILPQIWAWGSFRKKYIEKYVDLGISILPFEKKLYNKLNVKYVGHPLVDVISEKIKLNREEKNIIALLPGSRKSEISRLLPILVKCSKKMNDYEFILAVAKGIEIDYIKKFIKNEKIRLVDDVYDALSSAKIAIVCSGTATIEATIIGTPMVIIYKTSLISYLIARLLVKTKFIGLPNIIAGKEIFPEIIQLKVTTKNIINACHKILNDKENYELKIIELKEKLKRGAVQLASKIITSFYYGNK